MLHRLKGGGFRLRFKAGSVRRPADRGANIRHVEVIVWFVRRLVLDVLNPHLVRHIAARRNPIAPRPRSLIACYQIRRPAPRWLPFPLPTNFMRLRYEELLAIRSPSMAPQVADACDTVREHATGCANCSRTESGAR